MPAHTITPTPTSTADTPSVATLITHFKALDSHQKREVLEFTLLITRQKLNHPPENCTSRLLAAMKAHNLQAVYTELQYANQHLGTRFCPSHWGCRHD